VVDLDKLVWNPLFGTDLANLQFKPGSRPDEFAF
jgi:hypothetical protein